jgi:hypothetical protein
LEKISFGENFFGTIFGRCFKKKKLQAYKNGKQAKTISYPVKFSKYPLKINAKLIRSGRMICKIVFQIVIFEVKKSRFLSSMRVSWY